MYDWITENRDLVLYIIFVVFGLLAYNLGHHQGYIRGFRCGRRAGTKHPVSRAD